MEECALESRDYMVAAKTKEKHTNAQFIFSHVSSELLLRHVLLFFFFFEGTSRFT